MVTPHHEGVVIDAASPPQLLWECYDELFENVIPTYAADYSGAGSLAY